MRTPAAASFGGNGEWRGAFKLTRFKLKDR
jgi:hypothetical protein